MGIMTGRKVIQHCEDDVLIDQAALLEQMLTHWRHAETEGSTLSIFIIDVDKFSLMENKAVCFEQIVGSVRAQFNRDTDIIARYNRKQIIAITSGMDYQQTRLLADRIQKAIAQLEIFHPHSPNGRFATASIGHTTYAPIPHDNYGLLDMLITALDHTAKAKELGGNCCKSRFHSRILK
jgi:diguanylate cyclase (GGDEF)-like protein